MPLDRLFLYIHSSLQTQLVEELPLIREASEPFETVAEILLQGRSFREKPAKSGGGLPTTNTKQPLPPGKQQQSKQPTGGGVPPHLALQTMPSKPVEAGVLNLAAG